MNLTTRYLGIELPHPFMAGAGPMADTLDGARRLEDGGASALVLRSLFQEQIDQEAVATHHSTETHAESFGEATSYFPDPEEFVIGPDDYLEHLRRTKEAVGIPVFASLNGRSLGGWIDYARKMQQAGADGVEINLYDIATERAESGDEIERRHVEIVAAVAAELDIPVAAKLSPFYTSPAHFAHRLEQAGAAGIVVFNRFYEADIDVEELEMLPHLHLSSSEELLLRLRWLAILSGNLESATLAITGGVHTAVDAVKAIMCGAAAVETVSAILRDGPDVPGRLRDETERWLIDHEYESLAQMLGSMDLRRCPDPGALSRANYMHQLQTHDWS